MEAKDLKFEKECDECGGRGVLDGGVCPVCNGARQVPTELGEAILELLRHNN